MKIPFDQGEMASIDELAGAQPAFVNVSKYRDGVRTRPGLATWGAFPTTLPTTDPVVGIAPCADRVIYITQNAGTGVRDVWMLLTVDGSIVKMSIASSQAIAGTLRPEMAQGPAGSWVVAGGSTPQLLTPALTSQRLTQAPESIDVAFIASRAVVAVKNGDGAFAWSAPLDTASWDTALDFATAEARPDTLVGLSSTSRELWCFGATSLELFVPDPVDVFAPIAALDVGCLARSSIIRMDDGRHAWLDDRARFIISNGRQLQEQDLISDAGMARTIALLDDPSDVWGYRENIDNNDSLVWVIPGEGRAFVYDTGEQAWSERRAWSQGQWGAQPVSAYAWWPEQRLHLVGTFDGRICLLDDTIATDLGAPVRCQVQSGFMQSPTLSPVNEVRLTMRRGFASSAATRVDVKWRNDLGPWSAGVPAYVSNSSKYPLARIRPAGAPYYTRQYEFSWASSDVIGIIGAEEIGAEEIEEGAA